MWGRWICRTWKCRTTKKNDWKLQHLENDGPNRSPGICRTWKMTDQISPLEFARPGKWRTKSQGLENAGPGKGRTLHNQKLDTARFNTSAVSTGTTTVRTPHCNFYAPSATVWARTSRHSSLPPTMATMMTPTPPRRHPLPLSMQRLQQLLQTCATSVWSHHAQEWLLFPVGIRTSAQTVRKLWWTCPMAAHSAEPP